MGQLFRISFSYNFAVKVKLIPGYGFSIINTENGGKLYADGKIAFSGNITAGKYPRYASCLPDGVMRLGRGSCVLLSAVLGQTARQFHSPDRNFISCFPACLQIAYFFQIFTALYPAPCIYVRSAWERGCCQCISAPADAGDIIRFEEWIIDSNGKVCDPAAKRSSAEYRGSA